MEKFPLLDIVIGLSLIYTFLSIFASELVVFIGKISHCEVKQFRRIVFTIIGDPLDSSSIDDVKLIRETISAQILNHEKVVSAIRFLNSRNQWRLIQKVLPHLFAEALLSVIHQLPEPQSPALADLSIAPWSTPLTGELDQFLVIVERSPDVPIQLRTNLTRMIHRVQKREPDPARQMEALRHEIEGWFSCAASALWSSYQFHFKIRSMLVSLVVVIMANVDSLYIIRQISENTATRAVVTANVGAIQSCRDRLDSPDCTQRLASLIERTLLPVGWHPANRRKQFPQLSHVVILRTAGGWLLSGLAVSMGLRFWLMVFTRLGQLLLKGGRLPGRG